MAIPRGAADVIWVSVVIWLSPFSTVTWFILFDLGVTSTTSTASSEVVELVFVFGFLELASR